MQPGIMQSPPVSQRRSSRSCRACGRPQRVSSLRKILQSGNLAALETHLDADDMAAFAPLVDRDCDPPVVAAVRELCSIPVMVALLRRGALVNVAGSRGLTALHWVAMLPRLADTFNQVATDFSLVPWEGFSVGPVSCSMDLPFTCEERQLAAASCLLAHGAQADCEDCDGWTAANHADKNGHARLALFIRHWADLQVCHWLRKCCIRSRGLNDCQRPSLSTMPAEVVGAVCQFLAPNFDLPIEAPVCKAQT